MQENHQNHVWIPVWRRIKRLSIAGLVLPLLGVQVSAALASDTVPRVAVTMRPIHSLTASIMHGVGSPYLILDQIQSGHDAALRPSQMRLIQDADLVIWIGAGMERTLSRPIGKIVDAQRVLTLADMDQISWLALNDEHHHHDHDAGHDDHHDEDGHDDHHDDDNDEDGHDAGHDDHHDEDGHDAGHDDHHDEDGHDDHHDDDNDEDGHDAGHDDHHDEGVHDDGHNQSARDWHIWLDTDNIIVMVDAITDHLVALDPLNAVTYQANSALLVTAIKQIDKQLDSSISPGRYIAAHDAYGYFANRYGWRAVSALTQGHETTASVADVRRIQDVIAKNKVDCLISDPTSNQRSIDIIRDGVDIPVVVMDPIGFDLEPGPALFGQLLMDLGEALGTCHK